MEKTLANVQSDLSNPKLEGFWLGSDGDSMTVRRVNRWQFDVISEPCNGNENTYYKVGAQQVLDWAKQILIVDAYAVYIPHFPRTRWTQTQVDDFINKTCIRLCDPFYNGFALTAKGVTDFVVRRHPNRIEWLVNDSPADFVDVLKKVRCALAADVMWQYVEI